MKDIEKMLKNINMEKTIIPTKIEYKIQNALHNLEEEKKEYKFILKKIVTVFASLVIVFIGSVSAYATFGGTIQGKPILKWMGENFFNKYENYKENIQIQELTHNESEVKLVSVLRDEEYVILELNVQLSDEDKKYLHLGENMVTEQDIQETQDIIDLKRKEEEEAVAKIELQTNEENKFYAKAEAEEKMNERIRAEIQLENLLEYKDVKNTIYFRIDNTYIDNKECYLGKNQYVLRISDYEYKVYQIYFLSEDKIKEKADIKLSMRNIMIENCGEGVSFGISTINGGKYINLSDEINVNISKNITNEDTKVIIPNEKVIKYKNMSQKIEEIKITPLQIVAKVKTKIENVSLDSLTNQKNDDYIGIRNFKVYEKDSKELNSISYETGRIITYNNGKEEVWARGDIGTYQNFSNASLEITEIILIEKKENMDNIIIMPTVNEIKWNQESGIRNEEVLKLEKFEINLD